jgi:hypothetical protein
MTHHPHNPKRVAFWLLLAASFVVGLVLFFVVPHRKIQGELAFGFLLLLFLKHVGLLIMVGAPLTGALKAANKRAKDLLRKDVCKIG